jgi:nicotinamide phosphoribosyltransferase
MSTNTKLSPNSSLKPKAWLRQFDPSDTDSYKFGHGKQTSHLGGLEITRAYAYFEARAGAQYPKSVWFGLQALLASLQGSIITTPSIDQLEQEVNAHIGPGTFDRTMWDHIVQTHEGKLPLEIKSAPEGSVIPVGNVLFTVTNTDPTCADLVSYVETWISRVWYTLTTCTISKSVKSKLIKALETSSEHPEQVLFLLHDFMSRGVSSGETAGLGGLAHLVNFRGTDTFIALRAAQDLYFEPLAGYSVNATQHSCMTAGGPEGEFEIIEQIIRAYPSGILSMVLDSYDFERAVLYVCTKLKELVLQRTGKFVIRPDSGDPPKVILWVFQTLWEHFGGTTNSKGFKVLHPNVGCIYGDGLTPAMIDTCLQTLIDNGFETSCVFGMGGGLGQKSNRDTQRCAYKTSAVQTSDGVWHDVFKNPSSGGKKSKAGRLKLIRLEDGEWLTVRLDDPAYDSYPDQLVTVFSNGEITHSWTLAEVRARADMESLI